MLQDPIPGHQVAFNHFMFSFLSSLTTALSSFVFHDPNTFDEDSSGILYDAPQFAFIYF